jgi:hypothetical protein
VRGSLHESRRRNTVLATVMPVLDLGIRRAAAGFAR